MAKKSLGSIDERFSQLKDPRKYNTPQNFVILRHMALNLLKLETTVKAGIPTIC